MDKEQMKTAEQEKQIPYQFKLLCNNLDKLDIAIAILRDKLSPVLRDDLFLLSTIDTEKEDRDMVPLATQIRGIDRRVSIMLSTVRYFSEASQLK